MRQQKTHPISPAEQKRLGAMIRETVVRKFADAPRPALYRGLIDRAACGRTAPGLDVLALAYVAIAAGKSRHQARALAVAILEEIDSHYPPEEYSDGLTALLHEEELDAAADVAQRVASVRRCPESWQSAARASEAHGRASLRAADAFRHEARRAASRPVAA